MFMNFLKEKSAKVFTLGCRVNQAESAMIEDALRAAGFTVVSKNENANLVVVNSCALTEFAESKTRRAIKSFKKNHAFVCATGCLAQTNSASLIKSGADSVISNVEKFELVEILLSDFFKPSCRVQANSFEGELKHAKLSDLKYSGNFPISDRMNLKIQDGCDNACAYCIIPRARGLPKSRSIKDIVADAKNLVSRGAREIILTGINMSKFDASLVDLVDELNAIPELLRIALGSLEPPVPSLEPLAQRMADSGHKLAKHFHISLQSASDKILADMRRKYSVGEFFDALKTIKNIDSEIAIGSDVICGFPTETEADFEETCKNIKASELSFLHVFTYSPRPNTLAEKMPTLPLQIRKERADRLRIIANSLSDKFFEQMRGKIFNLLLENQISNGDYLGYTENYIQCAVKINEEGFKNKMAQVKILEQITADRMRAELIKIL